MSKYSLPRFQVAVNEAYPDHFSIIHTVSPIAIIGVFPGAVETGRLQRHVTMNDKPYTFVYHHLFSTDMMLLDDTEGTNMLIDKLTDRACHWFVNQKYLDNEE